MATHTIEPRPLEAPPVSFLDVLARMSPEERLAAYRSGGFTRRECVHWTARYPEEVPLLNGEYEWITLTLADFD